ncbi:MAG: glycosyltransferase [Desulfobulbaceae bacterium]|jgi:spore maturation protein CgeB|nr:glycosyltransferase [Desulfobulbaceae bacterium]
MKKNLLILDGISGISLGKEINESFLNHNVMTTYAASADLPHKSLYKLVSTAKKAIHRQILKEDYYRNPKITNNSINKLISETKPDLIVVIGFLYRFFDLYLIQDLQKKYGFKLYLYDTDTGNLFNHKRELLYFIKNELPLYEKIFSFSQATANLINKNKGLNCVYFPFGAKPIAKSKDPIKKEHDVLFVGSADMRRIFLLENLTPFNLVVYGSRWQRNKALISPQLNKQINTKSLWGTALHQELFKSKIILNITRSTFYGVETGINLRIFETLAAQGFLLTDHTQELADLFKIGEEIESYSSSEELLDKVTYYLANDEARNKIAQKGYDLFRQKYTWNSRIQELLKEFS